MGGAMIVVLRWDTLSQVNGRVCLNKGKKNKKKRSHGEGEMPTSKKDVGAHT